MAASLHPPGPVGVTVQLFAREAKARLASPWLYIVASFVCLIAWIYGAGFQQTFVTESVLVTTDPLMALNTIVIVFLGVVSGLRLAASLAWEREHRTLEILIVAAVPWASLIASKFLIELCILAVLVAVYACYLIVGQPLGAGVVDLSMIEGLFQLPVFALPVMALGLLASGWARTVRGAVVTFLGLVGLLAIFETAHAFLARKTIEQMSLSEIYTRSALDFLAPVINPVSAVAQMTLPAEAMFSQIPITATQMLGAFVLTVATLVLAGVIAKARGAVV